MSSRADRSIEELRALARRAGMELTGEELMALGLLYGAAVDVTADLHEIELGPEDPAVSFDPGGPESE